MHWYEAKHDIEGIPVSVYGSFKHSQLKIYAMLDFPDEIERCPLYHKTVNMWSHQDVLAEDILAKYEGMVKKCEQKLTTIVEKAKLKRRI